MDTIRLSQKEEPGDKKISSEPIQERPSPYGHELNIADGGEFLDDGIRMKDQPLGETTAKEKE